MEENKIYNNYHKHTWYSGIMSPDSVASPEDYCKRIKELGCGSLFTTEHGFGGSIFECRDLCDKYGIKCFFGMEGYIVKNPLEKDNHNYHIIIIPTTNQARKRLNKASSRANKEGYYYKPRLFIEDLLAFDKNDLYITTACIAGIIRDEDSIKNIFLPLAKHFQDHMFLEVQPHNNDKQKKLNKLALALAQKLNLKIIAANDSHYIYPKDAKLRDLLLKGKGMNYGDEDSFILDYPDYDTFYNRFVEQGVLTSQQIEEAIANTLVFDNCEEIQIDKDIKMPTLYPTLSKDERIKKLQELILTKFKEVIKEDGLTKEELPRYVQAIKEEFKTIEDTKDCYTMDYFLFNEKLVDLAIHKYGGVLTTTGRGSCASFYINRILGLTTIDRLKTPLPLYPARFMSTARIIENKSLPDIDNNIIDQKPFLDAARELLGDTSCYPMLAYGTMQDGEAFRNLCRAKNINYDTMNEVAKDLDKYKDNTQWKDLYELSQKFVGTIISCSVHPCSYLIMSGDIESEVGILKIGDSLCAIMTSTEADNYKYLKDDFLIVTVVKLIADTFKLIGIPIMNTKELLANIDDKVWDMYEKGLTCTLNQSDSDFATNLVKQYKPKNDIEMAMFVAALRPSFNGLRDKFIAREEYTTGSKDLDKVLATTNHEILFQENIMQYFEWLGITPAHSIGLIKKISKKKIKPEDFTKLEATLKENWIKNTGNENMFQETWELMQSNLNYSFNAPHGYAVGLDSIYGAYLKSHYPLEYYTIAFTNYTNDIDRTAKLTKELDYFGIRLLPPLFGKSSSSYNLDKSTNSIYKGVSSIKFLNSQCAEELYSLSQTKQYQSFPELYKDILSKTSTNARQVEILVKLDYFKEFGLSGKLLQFISYYNDYYGKKSFSINKEYSLPIETIDRYCNKRTEKQVSGLDYERLLNDLWNEIPNKTISLKDFIQTQIEMTGVTNYKNDSIPNDIYIVKELSFYSNKSKPYFTLYRLCDGYELKTKIKDGNLYDQTPFQLYNIMKLYSTYTQKKTKNVGGQWIKSDEDEEIVSSYEIIA